MKLVIGLGNVGRRYENTRHNVGFLIVDQLARQLEAGEWKPSSKLQAEIADVALDGQKLLLAKPQTMMNLSGEAVQRLIQAYKLAPTDVIVIHDDIDLSEGEIRTKLGGGAGGQKGIESIIAHIGPEFERIRIGIGRNERPAVPAEVYVLQPLPNGFIKQLPDIKAYVQAQIAT